MSAMFRKSLSLTVQLLLTLVGLVVVATGVLTVDAYRTSRQHLEVEARDVARLTAQQREQTIARMIDLRYQQAEGFLTSVASLCGDCLLYTSPSPRDGLLTRMPSSA